MGFVDLGSESPAGSGDVSSGLRHPSPVATRVFDQDGTAETSAGLSETEFRALPSETPLALAFIFRHENS